MLGRSLVPIRRHICRRTVISPQWHHRPHEIRNMSSSVTPEKPIDIEESAKLSPLLLRNISHEVMKDIQAASLKLATLDQDFLAFSNGGIGKSSAFLIPALQSLVSSTQKRKTVSIVIISPTRELAQNAALQARELLAGTDFQVKSIIGGRRTDREQKKIGDTLPDVLVATPGRFLSHIRKSGLQDILHGMRTLVLDEADILLDPSFKSELTNIIKALPSREKDPWQTMIFAGNLSEAVKQAAGSIARPNFAFIPVSEPITSTSLSNVVQECITTSPADIFPHLLKHISAFKAAQDKVGAPTKIILYNSTAAGAELAYRLLNTARSQIPLPIYRIHSRLEHRDRVTAAKDFGNATSAVLVSSDLTTRGAHFADVHLVIQVGMPPSPEQYALRLSQTGRAGQPGKGLLLLSTFEEHFLEQPEVKAFPILKHTPNEVIKIGVRQTVAGFLHKVGKRTKMDAYRAWLGFYHDRQETLGWKLPQLVSTANTYAQDVLCWKGEQSPPINDKTAGLLNIKDVPGVHVISSTARFRQPQLRGVQPAQ